VPVLCFYNKVVAFLSLCPFLTEDLVGGGSHEGRKDRFVGIFGGVKLSNDVNLGNLVDNEGAVCVS